MSASNDRPMDAVHALRDRGIDNPESLLEYAEPEAIVRTCEWWDGLKGVGPGLLVKRVREGGVSAELVSGAGATEKERKLVRLRAKFGELAELFVPGSVTEPHARMQRRPNGADPRQWREPDPEQICDGELVVVAVMDEGIEVRCDACACEAAYSLRSAAVLPDAPLAVGRDEPPVRPAKGAARNPRHEGRRDDLRRPSFAKAVQAEPEPQRLAA